ncbi:hypothetical protein KBB27_03980 [Patescibacteria group bacterium]|nr:hypothetical protein [Patescibacteria group bacterium]
MIVKCKHNMIVGTCGLCRAETTKPVRVPELQRSIKGASKALPEVVRQGYVVIATQKGRERCNLDRLNKETTFVHIDGQPFLWVVVEILARAPNLKTIQVIPSAYDHMNPKTHLKLCQDRGVQVVKGHHRPGLAWEEGEIRNPNYDQQKLAFLALGADAAVLFDEICSLGFEEALITSRYFCLKGEKYSPQREIGKEFGLMERASGATRVSARIYAVMKYLDPSMDVGSLVANRLAKSMKKRVERLRIYLANAHAKEELIRALGIPHLPTNMPLAYYEELEAVLNKIASPAMSRLAGSEPRLHTLVLRRYGLEQWENKKVVGSFRTLEELGKIEGVTRERVRQLLEKAYEILDIETD